MVINSRKSRPASEDVHHLNGAHNRLAGQFALPEDQLDPGHRLQWRRAKPPATLAPLSLPS